MTEDSPTTPAAAINSTSWWEHYHQTQWKQNDGGNQTRLFMEALVANLPRSIVGDLGARPRHIVDWGCALGEGVDVLSRAFPGCSVSGVDVSPTAIEGAREGFPQLTFALTENGDLPVEYDVVITSNCLEHFRNPLQIVLRQLSLCRRLYIALVPYNEFPLIEQHCAQFRDESFPRELGNHLRIHSATIDVDARAWPDKQLLVVYASPQWIVENTDAPEMQQLPGMLVPRSPEWLNVAFRLKNSLEQIEQAAKIAATDAAWAPRVEDLLGQLQRTELDLGVQLARREDDTRQLRERLDLRDREIRQLKADLQPMAAEIDELRRQSQRLRDQIEAHDSENETLRAELAAIYRSPAWRAMRKACTAVDLVAPPGSLVQRAVRGTLGVAGVAIALPLRAASKVGAAIGIRAPMTWYAFAFDRFKRRRLESRLGNLDGIRGAETPGLATIVLPVFNGEDYLRESLDSVLAQTYPDFELIAVDDGSTDATPAILAEYAARDPRVQVITQPNQKLPRALNAGFARARGEFLTWTSADNRLKPEFLEKTIACLRRHPDWDMTWANQDIIGSDGQPLRDSTWFVHYQDPPGSEHVRLPADPSELNVWANNYVGAAFLYRARVPALVGDYSTWRFGLEDYDYWMRVNELLTLRHADFDEPISDYRFHETSLTSRDKELGITSARNRLMVFDEFRRDFCLVPIVWFLAEFDESTGAECARLVQAIQAAGHPNENLADTELGRWPPLWIPSVYVAFASQSGDSPPDELPESTLRVLVTTAVAAIRQTEAWDLGVLVGSRLPPDAPHGWISVADPAALFTAIDIRCRSRHLERIESFVETHDSATLDASVIVCTYKRSRRLVRALESAAQQTCAGERYEVVVVDNGPDHAEITAIVEECRRRLFADRPDRLRLLHCRLTGLSYARNAGLSAAKGRYLLFLDDDAIASRDWVDTMIESFRDHPQAGIIGGRILLKDPDPMPEWLVPEWRSYWSHFDPGHPEYREAEEWWEFPWGANWAARRRALLESGGFRTHYGRVGSDYGGGEEIVAGQLAKALGWKVAFEPKSHVIHDVDPKRFSLEHVRRTIRSGMNVHYQTQRDLYTPMEPQIIRAFFANARQAIWNLVAPGQNRYDRMRAWARLSSASRLLCRQLADRGRRLRWPVSLRS